MAQTSTLIKFHLWKKSAKLFMLLLFTCMAGFAQAQIPIFTETVGRGSVNVSISAYQQEGSFDNTNFKFTGNGTILASIPSTGKYLDASGGNYIEIIKNQFVQIDGINTIDYTGLAISFGVYRNQNKQELQVEYNDGNGWKTVSIGTISGNGVWELKRGLTDLIDGTTLVPSSNASLRFTNISNASGKISLDDIRISGRSNAPAPIITDFYPKIGGEGTKVTIVGQNFQNIEDVLFVTGEAYGQDIEIDGNTLTFIVPADGETSKLRLITSDGKEVDTEEVFTFVRPIITSMTPSSGAIGTRVTIRGERLSSAMYAVFAGFPVNGIVTEVKAEIVSINIIGVNEAGVEIAEVVVDVPRGAVTGRVDIWTENFGYGRGRIFTVNKPAIFELMPNEGRVGNEITIVGDRLNIRLNGNPLIVSFTGENGTTVNATITSSSYGELKVLVPDGAITGPITVTTGEGVAISPQFTVLTAIIVLEGTVNPFVTNRGEPSASQYYSMTGRFLIDGFIDVVAPLHFEVSKDGITWERSIRYEGMEDATIGPERVYVRYNPSNSETSHNGNVTHSSTGVVRLLAVSGSVSTIPLPVELISFNAVKQNSAVFLTWATASEQDNDFFDVEMTEDLKGNFKAVGRVHSKVNTSSIKQNYQFSHNGNFTGTRYYRLKQVDLDGTFEYSKVVAVSANGMHMAAEPKVYPNPINPDSKLVYTTDGAGKLNVTIVNVSGTRIQSKSYDVEAGENTIVLNLSDNLPAGIYVLMTEFNGKTQQVKLIKQ